MRLGENNKKGVGNQVFVPEGAVKASKEGRSQAQGGD